MNNYFARFTEGAKKALVLAADAAKELGHNYVGTEHLLIGIAQEDGKASEMLAAQDITAEKVMDFVLQAVGKGDYVINSNFGYTPRVKKILELSQIISPSWGKAMWPLSTCS